MPRIDHAVTDPLIRKFREDEPAITAAEIGRRLRADHHVLVDDTVRTRLRLMGFEVIANKKQDRGQNERIAELYLANQTYNNIAADVGLSVSVVGKRIAEMGLGRRAVRGALKPQATNPRPRPKPSEPEPKQKYRTFLYGYPRKNQNGIGEIPPYVRTLPTIPSISGPEFGDESYYYTQEFVPVVVADGGDESDGPGGGDSSGPD